jgi:cold shock CspA family protein
MFEVKTREMGESRKGVQPTGCNQNVIEDFMTKKGTITLWNPERSFGFVTTTSGERFFFHRRNFLQGHQPVIDGVVEFEIGPGIATGKKPQAVRLRYSETDTAASEIFIAAKDTAEGVSGGGQ